ncbi:MAG: glycine cleavage system aminomethyltransferase GcvT [Planctomycetes bacterium]|nr:glycine cleavage system aminomethyltransferase GcvT [Planctomycetota bacterium]
MLRTPFYSFHQEHGGKFVDYAGWELPIHYGSILDEHHNVRTAAGIFDVSHMGRVKFSGRHARRFLELILTRRITDMKTNACRYALVCNERGGVLDDIIIYRFDDHWMMVCNAANRLKLLEHFKKHLADMSVKIDDVTESTGMVALQGPKVMQMIGKFSSEVPTLKRYSFCTKNLLILKLIISRTGYTGEDGVEVILPAKSTGMAIKLLLRETDGIKVKPTGLGARDTLRLEAGMPLYGHELSEDIDPLSAGLDFAVTLDKDQTAGDSPEIPAFIGQDALKSIKAAGPKRKLVGLKLDGRRTPRQHMPVVLNGQPIGEVTSGCLSPTLDVPIAMAYVDAAHAMMDTKLAVDFGKQQVDATVVPLPFYKRA